jgi:hypothetical protein
MSRYGSAVRWLARTLWEAFRWRVVRAIVAAQVGVLIIGGGLSLSLSYLQQMEQGGRLRWRGLDLAARDESTLAAMVGVVLITLLAGSGILYLAQRRIVNMAVELNHHVRMNIALAYGGELAEPADWRSERTVWRALWVLQTRDARRTAIVARGLLRNTVNVGIAVVGLAALFYLEARMTLLFLGVMAVAMISYYRTNAASARATRRYEAVAPTTRKGLHQLLPSFQTLSQPAPSRAELGAALDAEAVSEETDAFGERFGAHIHAEFLGVAIMGVALAALTAYMGREALAGAMPWTRLVAYVLVLRITLNAIQSLLRTFAFFSRFYPAIDRLNRFFAASNGSTNDEPLSPLALHAGGRARTEQPDATRSVQAGEVIEVILPVPLSRYSIGLLAAVLAGDDQGRRRQLLGHMAMARPLTVPPVAASMRSLLMLNGTHDSAALQARLGEHAATIEEAVGTDPDVVVPCEAWTGLPDEAMTRLVLATAEASRRPVLVLDRGLATTGELERLQAEASDRIVVVCSSGAPSEHDELGISRTVVASVHGDILAIGSPAWIAGNWSTITDLREEAPPEPIPVSAGAWSDEELDED